MARIRAIKEQLVALDHICAGTLHKRMKVCGKAACGCAKDPSARHGPYYEWSWWEANRTTHRVISKEQAQVLKRAMRNYREAKELLARWEIESAQIILEIDDGINP